jgi:hypothetical protein
LVQDPAAHDTSEADQLGALGTGGVKLAASAFSDSRSCLVAVANTMFETLTVAALEFVELVISPTVNVTPFGKLTRACSPTLAVSVVVWLVSARVTVVCAAADAAANASNAAPASMSRTHARRVNCTVTSRGPGSRASGWGQPTR